MIRVTAIMFVVFLALLPVSASADEPITWVRGYPEGAANAPFYVASWSDGSYSYVPWFGNDWDSWNRGKPTRRYPEVETDGCTWYVVQWEDGSFIRVPFSCPAGKTAVKPIFPPGRIDWIRQSNKEFQETLAAERAAAAQQQGSPVQSAPPVQARICSYYQNYRLTITPFSAKGWRWHVGAGTRIEINAQVYPAGENVLARFWDSGGTRLADQWIADQSQVVFVAPFDDDFTIDFLNPLFAETKTLVVSARWCEN